MPKERVLITVKTYPTLSRKYGETVCTAGVRADGTWMRIYPVPFRRLEETEQYRKFDWLETDFIRGRSDPRPETHHPADLAKMLSVGHMGTDDNWRERRELLLNKVKVYDRLEPLLTGAKENKLSLAMFKPTKIRGFIWEDEERDWNADKVAEMRDKTRQAEMFKEETWRETFKIIPKLPYSFSYQFEDVDGRKSTMQVLDWECGQLYWNCLRRNNPHRDEAIALEKVKAKYLDEFGQRDLHFFLGTTQQFHGFAPNPWVIVGVFAPPISIRWNCSKISVVARRAPLHQHGCVHVLHADDRSGDRHAGGGVQVRLCQAGFDGLSERTIPTSAPITSSPLPARKGIPQPC